MPTHLTMPWPGLDRAAELLRSTGVGEHARRSGDRAPAVGVLDRDGGRVHLADLWRDGPVVMLFFRGGWCLSCDLHLRAWRRQRDALAALGIRLVAVSPQRPDPEGDDAGFAILSDPDLAAANGFGIAFTLPPEAVDLYAASGIDIPVLNGNGLWVLPIPAVYVVGPDGLVRYAYVEGDSPEGVRPEDVLAAMAGGAA